MKTVVFSFDDGRSDTFHRALPVVNRYGFHVTVNIATDYIEHPEDYTGGSFKNRKPMTKEEVLAAEKQGHEIAGHGHQHKNTLEDINRGVEKLRQWGVNTESCGFASPYSQLVEYDIPEMRNNGLTTDIGYIRSGIQIRREGFLYGVLYFLMEKTGSKWLFNILNKSLVIRNTNPNGFYRGVTITGNTTVDQIMGMIEYMEEDSGVILIFHSILSENDEGYNTDRWGWNQKKLEDLCRKIKCAGNIEERTTKSFLNQLEGKE